MIIDRITANPSMLSGKPIIRGTRLSVEFILDLLASDVSEATSQTLNRIFKMFRFVPHFENWSACRYAMEERQ